MKVSQLIKSITQRASKFAELNLVGAESSVIKEKVKNAILDGEIINDYDQAFELMLKIGESIGLKYE